MNGKSRVGQVAVITGGARGFGLAFGKALADEGVHVVLVDLDGDAAEQAANEIKAGGGSAVGLCGDVTDEARIAEVMAIATESTGRIDTLINNAGLHSHEYSQPVEAMGVAKVRRLFDVNVMGTICCTLAALPFLEAAEGASVVNISSMAAHMGGTAYGNSKLAVAGLTVTLARELGPKGIRVNAISPGMIFTDTIRAELPETTKSRVKAMQFIDCEGAEQDIVEAMLYLTSSAARFVTGEVLRVTGGAGAGV
jgi:3-oxoacyl-[acyl-carrier protein] reductase